MRGKNHFFEVPAEFNHHHDLFMPHPVTGDQYWGQVKVTSRHLTQPGGPIILRAGRHIGPHKGFGIRHIWTERGRELQKWGYNSIHDVPDFVSKIIQDKAQIVCEFSSMYEYERLIVMRSRNGCVVLEARSEIRNGDEETQLLYSVVTAYRGRNPNGQSVGIVETKKP